MLVLDVDGVLTNGKINLDQEGNEIKVFDVQDGFGIALFRNAGYKTAIISARSAGAVNVRAKDLKIDKVYQDAHPKTIAYENLLREFGLKENEVCFMGDDLPDICILKRVGFSVAVNNAANEVKERADYVTERRGGDGAVREAVELILKNHGKWENIINEITESRGQK